MTPKKRVTRKELLKKPDEFITFSGKLIQFISTHKSKLSVGLACLFSILLIVSGIRLLSNRQENKAFEALEAGVAGYNALIQTKGPREAYLGTEKDFQNILKKYSRKKGGMLARVFFANICYDGGQFDRAIGLYKQSLEDFTDNPSIKNLILYGLGYAHEGKNESRAAVKYFEMIATGDDPVMKEDAYFNLGRLYHDLGNGSKSKAYFEKIVSDYTGSLYLELVKERLQAGT